MDQTLGYGCFLVATYEGGSAIRFGWNPKDKSSYLLVGNRSWRSLDKGKKYALTVQFDNLDPWTGDATAVDLGGERYLFLTITESEFPTELAERHDLRLFYKDEEILTLSLEDSDDALNELVECQIAVSSLPKYKIKEDPFSSANGDPFSN